MPWANHPPLVLTGNMQTEWWIDCICICCVSLISECEVLFACVPQCACVAVLTVYVFLTVHCTFIVLDKYSDLSTNKLSSICRLSLYVACLLPCFMTHCMFSFICCLCFSSQKHFATAGELKIKEGQTQQHNKPSILKKEGRKKERERNLTHNLRAHAACQIVWLNTWLAH